MSDISWESLFQQFMLEANTFPGAYGEMAEDPDENDFYIVEGVLTKFAGPGGDVVIPEGVTKIADMPFYGCKNVTSVTIPEGVTEIGDGAFAGCPDLAEIRVDERNQHYCTVGGLLLEKDGTTVHSCPPGKTGIAAVPEGVTKIASRAFEGCKGLTRITIPESVAEIGEYAFGGCKGLTRIFIPKNAACMGNMVFYGCEELADASPILADVPENHGEGG